MKSGWTFFGCGLGSCILVRQHKTSTQTHNNNNRRGVMGTYSFCSFWRSVWITKAELLICAVAFVGESQGLLSPSSYQARFYFILLPLQTDRSVISRGGKLFQYQSIPGPPCRIPGTGATFLISGPGQKPSDAISREIYHQKCETLAKNSSIPSPS